MLKNHAAYKYETTFKVLSMITHCWTSGTVTLQYGPTKIRYNIRRIKPNTYDTNVEDITPGNIYNDVNIQLPLIYFFITLNSGNKVYNKMSMERLTLSRIVCALEFFMTVSFSSHGPRLM